MALKVDAKFEGNWLVLSNMTWGIWQIFTGWKRLSSDFILESKMAQLNQIKNTKQLDRPDSVRKLYFAFEIKE